MKIVFVSDIHGCYVRLKPVLDFFDSHNADILCIGGDIINYGPRNGLPADGLDPNSIVEALNSRSGKIVAVRGNCDSEVDQMLLRFPILSDYAILVDDGIRFFITHGHKTPAGETFPWIKSDVIVSGHSHLWTLEEDNVHVVHLNTGSVTFPKGGNVPTFAYYENRELSILDLDGHELKRLTVASTGK